MHVLTASVFSTSFFFLPSCQSGFFVFVCDGQFFFSALFCLFLFFLLIMVCLYISHVIPSSPAHFGSYHMFYFSMISFPEPFSLSSQLQFGVWVLLSIHFLQSKDMGVEQWGALSRLNDSPSEPCVFPPYISLNVLYTVPLCPDQGAEQPVGFSSVSCLAHLLWDYTGFDMAEFRVGCYILHWQLLSIRELLHLEDISRTLLNVTNSPVFRTAWRCEI